MTQTARINCNQCGGDLQGSFCKRYCDKTLRQKQLDEAEKAIDQFSQSLKQQDLFKK